MQNSINYMFFLGGYDAEMCEIRRLLESQKVPFHDKHLSWGAKASDYAEELKNLQDEIPALIELQIDMPIPRKAIVIDHHNERAGKDVPTSIEQVAELLGIQLTRWQKLIAANDRGYIPGLKEAGATPEEIEKIRRQDRKCQGVTEEEEKQAEEICRNFSSSGPLDVLDIPFTHVSPITDRLFGQYQNLLIVTPDDINFFGDGKIVQALAKAYPGSWSGGNLPEQGFWGRVKKEDIDEIVLLIKEI
ncbi:MAG: hypothetical protein ACE5HI_10770 [bacterium]